MCWTIHERDLALSADALSTVFCVGNGRVCTRGTLSEGRFEAYRGVFVSGAYTRAPLGLMYFMGAPDWLPAWIHVDGKPALCTKSNRRLDMKAGVLEREATFAAGDATFTLREMRFASLARRNVMAQRIEVTRTAGGDAAALVLAVDGDTRQSPAKYYSAEAFPNSLDTGLKLTEVQSIAADEDCLGVVAQSPSTGRRACTIARVAQRGGTACDGRYETDDDRAMVIHRLDAAAGQTHVFEKCCAVAADLGDYEDAVTTAEQALGAIANRTFDDLLAEHIAAMEDFWSVADVEIEGDAKAQRDVRFAAWSTRIAAPDDGGRSSIGAKNLSGDWYRGAVFWDMEAFQLPLLAAVAPQLARNHLLYRHNRLDAARRLARQDGYRGARFPTQSFDSGFEDPPALGGGQRHEIHVSLEAAWACFHYHALTGDDAFMLSRGMEICAEVCNFWSTRVQRDVDGSFHLRNVRGPDQLHMPVEDNAYTNCMVIEVLTRADEMIERMARLDSESVTNLLRRIGVTQGDRQRWRDVAAKLHVPKLDALTFEQYAGHRELVEPSPEAIRREGQGADKIAKQADAVLIFQMIPWAFSDEQAMANYREHAPLCTHTSSLSFCTHALVAARLGLARDARRYFDWTGGVDLDDSMGNAEHGIHGAGEGGIWLAAVAGFGGLTVTPDHVAISPRLPEHWQRMRYRFLHRGALIEVELRHGEGRVTNRGDEPVTLVIQGEDVTPAPGEPHVFACESPWRAQSLEGVILTAAALKRLSDPHGTLEALKQAGLRVAAIVDGEADARGFEGFDAVVDASVVAPVAGNPQAFAVAAQRLRVLSWDAIAVVDGEADIAAARRASMLVVDPSVASPDALNAFFTDHEPTGNPYLETNIAIAASEARARH